MPEQPEDQQYDDVPPEAYSGVHRGPLRAGEWVRLTDSKGRRVIVPTEKLAFVELGSPAIGQVGFRS